MASMQGDVEGSQAWGGPAGADGSSYVNWSALWVPRVSTKGQGAYVKYCPPHRGDLA